MIIVYKRRMGLLLSNIGRRGPIFSPIMPADLLKAHAYNTSKIVILKNIMVHVKNQYLVIFVLK